MRKMKIVIVVLAGFALAACGQKQAEHEENVEQPNPIAEETACTPTVVTDITVVEIVPGLSSRTLTAGCGDIAVNGQTAVVHYTGWLFDAEAENQRGEKFDSSRDRGQHFEFPLGGGRVIKGWDQGVAGMAIGEVRELTIAPGLAYGDRDMHIIPPGSTLVFEVELAALK